MFSKYETKARIFPAIITVLPLLIFSHFFLYKIIPELLDSTWVTKIVGDISIVGIFLYVVIQISRFFSKKLFQDTLFNDELHFPTTNYLLYSDSKYSRDRKEQIRNKIIKDFSIRLLSESEENYNQKEARIKINEAVKLIRTKVKDGRLLLQHNIEYGFVRNLLGGLIISIPFSIFNIAFFDIKANNIAAVISIIFLLFYIMILVFHKKILRYYACNYADVLFNEYLILNVQAESTSAATHTT